MIAPARGVRIAPARLAPRHWIAGLLRSEWIKLGTVRSTYWTALLAVVSTIGIGVFSCVRWVQEIDRHPDLRVGFDPTLTSLNGVYLAQVAAGALGVLVISSEYATGMIRATFTAAPQRRAVLAAKGSVFAAATLVVGELLAFVTVPVSQAVLHRSHAGVSLGDPGVLRATIGAGLYLTVVGVFGFGLGAVIRHTAGAITAFFVAMFAPSALLDLLPTDWRNVAIKYAPANAGSQILTVIRPHDSLTPWTGLAVLAGYAALAVALAFLLVGRRDA